MRNLNFRHEQAGSSLDLHLYFRQESGGAEEKLMTFSFFLSTFLSFPYERPNPLAHPS